MDEAHEPALRDPTSGEVAQPSSDEVREASAADRPGKGRKSGRRSENKQPTGARNLLIAASAVVLIAGLKAASAIIIPFLVAVFIAAVSLPLMTALTRRGWTPGFAVLVTIACDLAVLMGLILVVSSSVNELVRERAKYERRIAEFRIGIENQIEDSRQWLEARGVDTHAWFEGRIVLPGGRAEELEGPFVVPAEDLAESEAASEAELSASAGPVLGIDGTNWLISLFDVSALIDTANAAVRGVANTLVNTLIVVLITTFVLLEAATFPQKLRRAFGNSRAEERFGHILFELRRYLTAKMAISATTGLIVGVWVAILGVDFAPLWGLLAFALNFIPNLGSIIAAGPPVLLALVQQGFGLALLVAAGYLAVNVVIGNFVEPQVMGRRLGLSTLVVFLSLVFWGWVWGPVGMLLSVPLTMVLKILLENSRDFRWMAVLLEGSRRGRRPQEKRGRSKGRDRAVARRGAAQKT